jgi:hypothetical protein
VALPGEEQEDRVAAELQRVSAERLRRPEQVGEDRPEDVGELLAAGLPLAASGWVSWVKPETSKNSSEPSTTCGPASGPSARRRSYRRAR